MSIIDHLETALQQHKTSTTPVLSGYTGAKALAGDEVVELGEKVLNALREFNYTRMTVQKGNKETRITYVDGEQYNVLALPN